MIGNNSENSIYSPDSFRYHGDNYERDVHTDRHYRLETSRNLRHDTDGALVKRRISYDAYMESYKNCYSKQNEPMWESSPLHERRKIQVKYRGNYIDFGYKEGGNYPMYIEEALTIYHAIACFKNTGHIGSDA
jgi:hypothetical protein